jgi:protein-disulfide isomerase
MIRFLRGWMAVGLLSFGTLASAWGMKGPKINVSDDPSYKEGSPNLVLVEVSDFQCPYCGQAAREVLPKVVEKYVRPGQVELVFLDLPLQMHPDALKAAEAAACANDQGKFWEMHNLLFANQRALGVDSLPGYAEKAGLDVAAFSKCLASGKKQGGIREDVRTVGFLDIHSTPTLLLGRRVAGGDKVEVLETLHGPTYEELAAKVDSLLAAK